MERSESDMGPEIVLPSGEQEPSLLVVQNDPRSLERVTTILTEAALGFGVVQAGRLSSALAQIVRRDIVLILTDLDLPDSSGADTVRYLVRAAPNLPVLVLAADDDIETALECIHEGAEEFMGKRSLDGDVLTRLVRIALQRRSRAPSPGTGGPDPAVERGAAALESIGGHLLRVADRKHLTASVMSVKVEGLAAMAGEPALAAQVARAVSRTLRRCDLVVRVGAQELAAVLLGDDGSGRAAARVDAAISAGRHEVDVRIGVAAYDPDHPRSIGGLLDQARSSRRPVRA